VSLELVLTGGVRSRGLPSRLNGGGGRFFTDFSGSGGRIGFASPSGASPNILKMATYHFSFFGTI